MFYLKEWIIVLRVPTVIRRVETIRNNTLTLCFALSPCLCLTLKTGVIVTKWQAHILTRMYGEFNWLPAQTHGVKYFTLRDQKMWLLLMRVLQKITQRGCYVPGLRVSVTFHYHQTAAHEMARTKTHMTFTQRVRANAGSLCLNNFFSLESTGTEASTTYVLWHNYIST